MKKFTPKGAAIKKMRGQLERLSTQKEFAHEIGEPMCGVELNKEVHMIVNAADREAPAAKAVHRPTQIIMECFSPYRVDDRFPISRRKDDVIIEAEVG